MKTNLLSGILLPGCMFMGLIAKSQTDQEAARNPYDNNNDNKNTTYAVTDVERTGVKWNSLRTLDLRTGTYSNILVTLLNNSETQPPPGTSPAIPYNGVAALAFDEDNRKVFYTPMLTDQLYYIDLRTMNRYLVTNHFAGLMPKSSDQGNIVTRMVIGDDSKAYALTNDGKHLIRFRTNNNNPAITDLGSLIDAPGNNEMSVHNLCSSFGGDLIADEEDHLYLFTSRNHVFKINIQTRIAKYLGTVSNLPASFTTSGAVVNKQEKKIVIVSAADSSDVYTVNLETLVAHPFHASRPWHPADLANASVLKTREHHGNDDHDRITFAGNGTGSIQLYPNPVTNKEFKIQFNDAVGGKYTIEIRDVSGKSILTKEITISSKINTIPVNLPGIISSGIYFVRITCSNSTYSAKILVE